MYVEVYCSMMWLAIKQEQQLAAGAETAAASSRQHGSDTKAAKRVRADLRREKAVAAEMQLKLKTAEEQVCTHMRI